MLQRLGRYEVLETLAGGGQGTVYLGREDGREIMGRKVLGNKWVTLLRTIRRCYLIAINPCGYRCTRSCIRRAQHNMRRRALA